MSSKDRAIKAIKKLSNRTPITPDELTLIHHYACGTGFRAEMCLSILRKQQDWITPKQREVLLRKDFIPSEDNWYRRYD